MTNCSFANNFIYGNGTIQIKNRKVFIINTIFDKNSAVYGGAIYYNDSNSYLLRHFFNNFFHLDIDDKRDLFLSQNFFINNIGDSEGGAIKYVEKRPIILKNNFFLNNSAPYGNKIASYPLRIIIKNYTEIEFILYRQNDGFLNFFLIDIDKQHCSKFKGLFDFLKKN